MGTKEVVRDAEQLWLTILLFDASVCDVDVVGTSSPAVVVVGDFNMERTKIPCLVKGISLGTGLI